MRSGYELDCYFKSKRFRKRLDFFRRLGKGYEIAGAIFIVNQFELMHYHYGIIQHYILTGKYSPEKQNRPQFEIINYTERQIVGAQDNSQLEDLDLKTPSYGVHILLPPGTTQKSLIEFVTNKENFKQIKTTLNKAYKGDPGNKSAFRPTTHIDKYLEIVDDIDEKGGLTPALCINLSIDYAIDEADIRKVYKKLGAQNNYFLNPAT
jgi:hypothetical protein